MMRRISLLVLIAILPLISLGQKRSILLELNKGETYKSSLEGTISVHQTIDDANNKTEIQYAGKMLFYVNDIDKELYTLSTTYTSIAIDINRSFDGQGISMSFSSDTTVDVKNIFTEILNKVLQRMTNKTFTVTMNKTGTIKQVIGYKEVFRNAIDSTFRPFGQLDAQAKSELELQLSVYLDKTFSDDAIKSSFENFFDIYTNKAVAVNDQWSNDIQTTDSSTLDNKTTYTLKEQNKDYLLISATGTMVIDEEKNLDSTYSSKSHMKGDEVGTFKIDPVSGWIIEAKTSSKLYGQIHLTSDDQPSDNKTVPISIISTSTISNK